MTIKFFLLLACLSISQSFAGHAKKYKQKNFSKTVDYFDQELNPKCCAHLLTKILFELKRTTPPGHTFSSEIAINHLLNNISDTLAETKKPYYIKINDDKTSK